VDALVWSTVYISEAFKKKNIFYKRFGPLLNALRKAFYTQGREAMNYWDYFIEEQALIDATRDKEVDQAFDILGKLVSMQASLLSYLTLVLLRSGTLRLDVLRGELGRRGLDSDSWLLDEKRMHVVAAQFNKHFPYLRSRGLTSLASRLSEDTLAVNEVSVFRPTLATIHQSYEEIRSAVRQECPERELLEGERFRYSWRFERARPRSEPYQPGLFPVQLL